jgi:hypothetical protein
MILTDRDVLKQLNTILHSCLYYLTCIVLIFWIRQYWMIYYYVRYKDFDLKNKTGIHHFLDFFHGCHGKDVDQNAMRFCFRLLTFTTKDYFWFRVHFFPLSNSFLCVFFFKTTDFLKIILDKHHLFTLTEQNTIYLFWTRKYIVFITACFFSAIKRNIKLSCLMCQLSIYSVNFFKKKFKLI